MAECDHPTPDQQRIVAGSRVGEYVVRIGSDLAQGPIPGEKIEEARRPCFETTGATTRTLRSGDRQCPKCGAWWSDTSISPAHPGDRVPDDLLST
jgi:hypothetical protein